MPTIHAIFLLTVRRIPMFFSLKPSPYQRESSLKISARWGSPFRRSWGTSKQTDTHSLTDWCFDREIDIYLIFPSINSLPICLSVYGRIVPLGDLKTFLPNFHKIYHLWIKEFKIKYIGYVPFSEKKNRHYSLPFNYTCTVSLRN